MSKTDSERLREIAYMAWQGAANRFRLYPDNKHTFADYWDGAKDQFDQFLESDKNAPSDEEIDKEFPITMENDEYLNHASVHGRVGARWMRQKMTEK